MDTLRFTVIAVSGLVLDVTIAFGLAKYFGTPLWMAAATGFVTATFANYLAHELWTFRYEASRFSWLRGAQYSLACAVTLLIRLLIIAFLSLLISERYSLLILIVAAMVSFVLNFLLSKFYVFSRNIDKEKWVE